MPDSAREKLAQRLRLVHERMEKACRRAGRDPASVTLVAVTKSVSNERAAELADLGVSDLGENRPQELWRKRLSMPAIRWHLIGHLQRNKISQTLPVHLIHSVDSVRLMTALEAEGSLQKVSVPVLLQVNISGEPSKQGFAPHQLPQVCDVTQAFTAVRVAGLMTMAPLEAEPEQCRPVFRGLRELAETWSPRLRRPHELAILSMGMSQDYTVAIEEGATVIRIGSALFGESSA
jgi:pyridoxal phosphate enzyme (YggS family)